MKDMLIKYVYDESVKEIVEMVKDERGRTWARLGRGKKIGVIVSLGPDKIGYSICRHPDQFDKETAINIAKARALGELPMEFIPSKALKAYKWMKTKVERLEASRSVPF